MILATKTVDEEIIQFLNQLLNYAVINGASDIHIEPQEFDYRIRLRIEGELKAHSILEKSIALQLVTRLKVLTHLNISERRLPQDGRYQFKVAETHSVNIRINSCPTFYGEKIVLRLLDTHKMTLQIDTLGMNLSQQEIFLDCIRQPKGLILVTGPTGCGKTVTLYSALNYLNQENKNISTVEDPIEIHLPGINQIAVHPQIGLGFADILRSLLRQDPDIIMIGEIRDNETAQLAIHAAQTGHLVLSTLHTNSIAETFIRMHHLGIANFDLASALLLIVNQSLVMDPQLEKRTGLFSIQPFNSDLRSHLQNQQTLTEILNVLTKDYDNKPHLQMVR